MGFSVSANREPLKAHFLHIIDVFANLPTELLNADIRPLLEEFAYHAVAKVGDGGQILVASGRV